MPNTALIAVIVILSVAVLCLAGALLLRNRRTDRLRRRFGPEYDQAIKENVDKSHAEAALEQRERRVERLRIRPLKPGETAHFTEGWRKVQARFVDDPGGAVADADQLLGDVMSTRGYPVGDFDQRAADISVDHPKVVENYRAAHRIALLHAHGEARTEDLRQAMIHYRTLFMDLVGKPELTSSGVAEEPARKERKGIL